MSRHSQCGNTATAGGASTITLDASASSTDNIYNGELIYLNGGLGVGQTRTIIGYNGTSKVATVDRAWQTQPDNTTTFMILADDTAKLDSSLQVTVTQAFPANFSAFSIDSSGRVDIGKIRGTASAGAVGYMGIDWSNINAPTSTVNLSNTTIKHVTDAISVTGTVDANLVTWLGSPPAALSAAGSVASILANGEAHGGTLGSSTATLALSRLYVVSQTSNTDAVKFSGNGSGFGQHIPRA